MNNLKNIFISDCISPNRSDSSYLNNLIHKENKLNPNLFGYPSDILDEYSQELNDTGIQLNKENQFDLTETSLIKDKSFDINLFNTNISDSIKNKNNLINEPLSLKDYQKESIKLNEKKKRGRKTKCIQDSFINQNKFSNDNFIRKCKSLVLTYALEFLNYQLRKIYSQNIGNGIHIKQLLDINQEQKTNNSINYMRNFLTKSLKEIFSAKISSKYTSFLPNHNEIIIKRALNDKDENKREIFNKLFNLTFIDCLKKFIGNKNDEFDGFPLFDEIKLNLDEDDENLEKIKESLINYENIIKSIKPRKKRITEDKVKCN